MTLTNDKLVWIYTDYGKNRLAEILSNPLDKLYLYKFKIGNANNTYYIPESSATNLISPIENGTFFINRKGILDDNLTVWFTATFPENSCGYEIREVGLYETINGIDYLFAISTCQPFAKPLVSDNYYMSVDYTPHFKSTNLAAAYDQIVIDANSEYVTQEEFDNLQMDITYAESNLMDQVSRNSHIVGLDRASQLGEEIIKNKSTVSNSIVAQTYLNLLNYTSLDKIASYWVFNYTKYLLKDVSVVDLSSYSNYLTTSKNLNLLNKGIVGLMPYINFENTEYFKLPYTPSFKFTENDSDSPFLLSIMLKHNQLNTKSTILAKANYNNGKVTLDVYKTDSNALEIIIYTDVNNYIKISTTNNVVPSEIYLLNIIYNGDKNNPQVDVYINLSKISTTFTETGIYNGITENDTDLASFTTSNQGLLQNHTNSSYFLISLIKDNFSFAELRNIMLSIFASMGKSVCSIV